MSEKIYLFFFVITVFGDFLSALSIHKLGFPKTKANTTEFIKDSKHNTNTTIKFQKEPFQDLHDIQGNKKEPNLVSLISEGTYTFDRAPERRDAFIYNEIFSPWNYEHLYMNYFNPWYVPEIEEDTHNREKRQAGLYYEGDFESQFTPDHIDEYINLGKQKVFRKFQYDEKRPKREIKVLQEAFQKVEDDLTELVNLKGIKKLKKIKKHG